MKLEQIKTDSAFNYSYLLKRIFPYIKPVIGRIIIAFLIVIPLGLLDGVTAFVLRPYLDVVVNGKEATYFGFTLTKELMELAIPIGVVFFAVIQGTLRYLNTYLTDWINLTIANGVKLDLYKKLISLDCKFYDDNSSGLVISRFLTDPDLASRQLINSIKAIIMAFTSAVGLIFVLLYNSWQLAIVGILILGFAFIPMTLLRKKIKQVSNKTTVVTGGITTSFNETYQGNRVITGNNLQEKNCEKVNKLIRETFALQISLTKRVGWLSPIMYLIASIGIAFVMFFGNYLINHGQLTAGSFASFVTSLLLLYKPVKTLGHDLTNMQNIFVAISRVFELFDFNSRIKNDGKKELNFTPENIDFNNVSFGYEENKEILHNINLNIKKGETVAIVGNSGGGKSTIVNLLPRFYDVSKGAILFNGTNIKEFDLNSLRDSISQVFQDNFLFSGTIKENILLGKLNATDEEINNVIKAAHLDEFLNTLPNGIDTYIGENGSSLSGGQCQRVAIARAMIKNAPIVVLDEATSALDNESEKIVQKALDNLMQDKTVFVIAHRLSTIFNAHKIIVMDSGYIVETGTHEELLNIPDGKYRNLYNMQFKVQENILEK